MLKGPVESLSVGEIRVSLRQSLVKLGVGFLSRDPKLQLLIGDLEVVLRSSNKGTLKTGSLKSRSSTKSGRGKWMVVVNIARFLSVSITELVLRKGEGSPLVPYVQVPTFLNGQELNDQSPGNHIDGGLTGSLPFQRLPRAPNNTNPMMLIDLGKGAMTQLVNSVKACTSKREFNVDIPPIGDDNETAGKMITKIKHWKCDQ